MVEEQKTAQQFLDSATAKWKEGKHEEAIALCDQALELNPKFAEAYSRRGTAKYDLGKYEEAIADYNEAIRLNQDFAPAFYNRGTAKGILGKYDEAIADFNETIRLKPDYADAFNNRGAAKTNLRKYEEAIADFSEAIRLKPDFALAFSNLAILKSLLGLHDEAMRNFDKAANLSKINDAEAYYNRGTAKLDEGKFTEAIEDLTRSLEVDKGHYRAFYYRGNAYAAINEHEKAFDDYEAALEIRPSFPAVFAQRAKLRKKLRSFDGEEADIKQLWSVEPEELDKVDPALSIIKKEIGRLGIIDGKALFVILAQLYNEIKSIKEEHIVDEKFFEANEEGKINMAVAHYTTLEALCNMLPDGKGTPILGKNFIRLYNVSYMNDPDEGKQLIHRSKNDPLKRFCLHELFDDEVLTDAHHKLFWGDAEYTIYVSSFTQNVDRLDLWRAYGGDGASFAIETPFSTNIFARSSQSLIRNAMFGGKGVAKPVPGTDVVRPTLYRVKYAKGEMEGTLTALNEHLNKFLNFIRGEAKAGELKKIARVLLSEVLYLYKHNDYKNEKEARIMAMFDISDPRLSLDERKPAKIYAETEPFLFKEGSKIYIGPKVKDKVGAEYELKYRITHQDESLRKTTVAYSKVQYR